MTIHGFGIRSIDDSEEGVVRFLRRNPGLSVVAVNDDGEIIGGILCGHDGRRGCLYHVCVHEAYRLRGIGKAMVVFCMEALKKENISICLPPQVCRVFACSTVHAFHFFGRFSISGPLAVFQAATSIQLLPLALLSLAE